MRKALWLITALAFGLGGYYLGQQPDSPRIFEWVSQKIEQFDHAGGQQWLNDKLQTGRREVSGLFERREPAPPQAAAEPPDETPPIPQCW